MIRRPLLILLILSASLASCSSLPRDPKKTLQHVEESKRLRVGLVEHPPWVVRTEGEPAGVEVELVRRFAAELGATPDWGWGGEQEQMEALEHYKLDLLIGGFTKETAWKSYVGLTSPYTDQDQVMAVPPGENGFIKRLDEFLYRQRGEVKGLLQQESRR
ncbi:MAG: transporter substrate-binding domain-containing protein [Acidobacteriota bacterium]|nr:transporter substrate-binding domain-containing protein [Acidobacteriota bacterium]